MDAVQVPIIFAVQDDENEEIPRIVGREKWQYRQYDYGARAMAKTCTMPVLLPGITVASGIPLQRWVLRVPRVAEDNMTVLEWTTRTFVIYRSTVAEMYPNNMTNIMAVIEVDIGETRIKERVHEDNAQPWAVGCHSPRRMATLMISGLSSRVILKPGDERFARRTGLVWTVDGVRKAFLEANWALPRMDHLPTIGERRRAEAAAPKIEVITVSSMTEHEEYFSAENFPYPSVVVPQEKKESQISLVSDMNVVEIQVE